MIAVTTYATKGYLHAMHAQMPLLVAALTHDRAILEEHTVRFIMASDKTKE